MGEDFIELVCNEVDPACRLISQCQNDLLIYARSLPSKKRTLQYYASTNSSKSLASQLRVVENHRDRPTLSVADGKVLSLAVPMRNTNTISFSIEVVALEVLAEYLPRLAQRCGRRSFGHRQGRLSFIQRWRQNFGCRRRGQSLGR